MLYYGYRFLVLLGLAMTSYLVHGYKKSESLMQRSLRFFVAGCIAFGLLMQASVALAAGVVISQVYGGNGSTYNRDYVEVFNASSSPVNISGWSIQYASATGTGFFSGNGVTVLNGTLQPGQYYLVALASSATGAAIPSPDASATVTVTNLSGSAGKVVLVNGSAGLGCNGGSTPCSATDAAKIVDLVGYGSANYSESAAAPALTASTALFRSGNGCGETNNNSTDFSTGTPAPRNSASPLNPCGVVAGSIVPTCPSLALNSGVGGFLTATATDSDSIVNGVTITSAAISGITLGTLTPANANGGVASVNVNVASTVANGIYPVVLNFTNNASQNASCTANINIGNASTRIYDIQGSGDTSPLVGTTKTVDGIVTLKMANGFYMQDATGDGNPATSDGIFVFTSTAPTISVGDNVRVTGNVVEFDTNSSTTTADTITELTGPTIAVLSSGNTLPSPVLISLPTATQGELERYEGMLVTFSNTLTVSQNYFQGRYGQVTLSNGRLFKPTNLYSAGSAQAIAAADLNARNMIIMDDGLSSQNPNPTPYIGQDNTLRAGDAVTNLTGVIDYGLATSSSPGLTAYRIHPTAAPTITRVNARTAAPAAVSGNVKVASFNVLNYFTTFTNGQTASGQTGQGCTLGGASSASNCRGANNAAEFTRQRDKIINAIAAINADVVGLMEIQNNGNVAVQNLVDGLNAKMGAGTYARINDPATGLGDDAIKVAMIYKPAKISPFGASLSDTNSINNRPTLAQGFVAANGEKFSVVVNHLKSKGSCPSTSASADPDQDQGDGQGCWNDLRNQQATRLANTFIPALQAAVGDADVIVIGDLNAYGKEDPINTLANLGFADQVARFNGQVGYSYVFDGEAGYLDHALANASMAAQITGTNHWRINADEPFVIDYNTEFKQPACATCGPDYYTPTPYRSSDHDPLIVGLSLQAPQILTFNALADKILGDADFNVTATSNIGLTVTFTTQTPAVCTVSTSGAVHLVNTGVCSITATQAGSADYLAAQVVRTFSVNQAALTPQTITFNALPNKNLGDVPFGLAATASSGLPVTFSSQTPSICSVAGNTVSLLQAGTCSITASQAGNATYAAATDSIQSFTIASGNGTGVGNDGEVPIAPIWLFLQGIVLAIVMYGLRRSVR